MKRVWAFATIIGLQACMVSGPATSQQLIKHTQATQPETTEAYKPETDMADIKLASHLSKARIVAGELLAIRNTLSNSSTSPIEIEIFRQPPLSYQFRDHNTNEVIYQLNALDALGAISPEAPPRLQRFKTITAGGDLILGEVVSNYLSPSFRPGHYNVTTHLKVGSESLISEAMDLIVEAPKTDQLENIQCAWMGCNITGFIHQSEAPRIYLRETNGAMLNGSFSRIDRAPGVKVGSLSSSIHLAPRIDGRWSAWIESGALFYAPLWGQVGRASENGVVIPLSDPQLLQPGFQANEEQAMFLILGRHEGSLAMLTATVSESGVIMGAINKIENGLPEGMPDRVLLRYIPEFELEEPYVDEEDESENSEDEPAEVLEDVKQMVVDSASIQMVLVKQQGDETIVSRLQLTAQGAPQSGSTETVYQTQGRLLATEMESFARTPDSFIHLLTEMPAQESKSGELALNYQRVPIAYADKKVIHATIQAPTAPVTNWAINGRSTGGYVVIAATGEGILYTSANRSGWASLADAAGYAGSLGLSASVSDAAHPYWEAFWLTDQGIRTQRDPSFVPK